MINLNNIAQGVSFAGDTTIAIASPLIRTGRSVAVNTSLAALSFVQSPIETTKNSLTSILLHVSGANNLRAAKDHLFNKPAEKINEKIVVDNRSAIARVGSAAKETLFAGSKWGTYALYAANQTFRDVVNTGAGYALEAGTIVVESTAKAVVFTSIAAASKLNEIVEHSENAQCDADVHEATRYVTLAGEALAILGFTYLAAKAFIKANEKEQLSPNEELAIMDAKVKIAYAEKYGSDVVDDSVARQVIAPSWGSRFKKATLLLASATMAATAATFTAISYQTYTKM